MPLHAIGSTQHLTLRRVLPAPKQSHTFGASPTPASPSAPPSSMKW